MTEAPTLKTVALALERRDARWFPGLGRVLADAKWKTVVEVTGINCEGYGTVRYFARDPSVPRNVVAAVGRSLPSRADRPVLVERLQNEPLRRYTDLGLMFYEDVNMDCAVAGSLDAAFSRLGLVPGAADAVAAVLFVLHAAVPEGPDYDVGYSDPDVPFSITVGVHTTPTRHGDLRLAEGILHECMHLQLSLIEEVLPLVQGENDRAFSPWQGVIRPVRGLLHGLYVFRVVQDFHRYLLLENTLTAEDRAYVDGRVKVIEEEISSLGDFVSSNDLTPAGRQFVRALLLS